MNLPAHLAVTLTAVLDGATTYPELMARLGVPRSTLQHRLFLLRQRGLVDWEPRTRGTIRPRCCTVTIGGEACVLRRVL